MMLIAASLHLAGFFDWVVHKVIEHLEPEYLLPGIVFTSGILSAFLVNDVVCLVMAPLMVGICKRMGVRPSRLLAWQGGTMESAQQLDSRWDRHAALKHRQPCSNCNAAERAHPAVSRSPSSLADAGNVNYSGRQPDDHRLSREHHRCREGPH